MSTDGKTPQVVILSRRRRDEQFIPQTGNPENGDYLDWYNYLQEREQEGEVVPLRR